MMNAQRMNSVKRMNGSSVLKVRLLHIKEIRNMKNNLEKSALLLIKQSVMIDQNLKKVKIK